ncbi:MAG: PAS domain-containing protein [Acidimicrobiia bacterium]|nr:PAS domain-containing protein [Acidimicrobiia bacterium]
MKSGLGTKLAISYVLSVIVVFVITAVFIDQAARSGFIEELTTSTQAQSRAVAIALGASPVERSVDDLAEALGIRITVVDANGVVEADSDADPATMNNHNSRPEIIEAWAEGMGTSTRLSQTVGEELLYVAIRDGNRVVRLSVPLEEVRQRMIPVRLRAILGALVVSVAGLAVVGVVSRRTQRLMQALTTSVTQIAAGQSAEEVLVGGRLESSPEVSALSGAVRSLSDQIHARVGELETEQDLRDRVLEALDEGVLLLRGRLVDYANPAARRMLGSSLSDDGRLRNQAIAKMAAERAAPTRMTVGARLVDVVVEPSADQSVVVLRDVTDRVRTESIRRDFVADASHELKTPVAAIRAAAETIQTAAEDGDMAAVSHFSRQVEASAYRLGRIVSDLLDLSRLEARDLDVAPTDLAAVSLEEVAAAELNHLTVTVDLDPLVIQASAPDVALALRNLLSNAARHTDAGGTVHVEVKTDGHEAVVLVADSGSGIPARDLPRIFERFYRVDTARSRHTGATGLGLAIVRHVAERHGGSVSVESELGVGSTFRIRFPLPTSGFVIDQVDSD